MDWVVRNCRWSFETGLASKLEKKLGQDDIIDSSKQGEENVLKGRN